MVENAHEGDKNLDDAARFAALGDARQEGKKSGWYWRRIVGLIVFKGCHLQTHDLI